MNKLVSRNPIQRFKKGKKIGKFQNGRYIQIDSNNDIWQDNTTGKKYQRNWNGRHWNRTPEGSTGNDFNNYFKEYVPEAPKQRIGMNGKPIIDTYSQTISNVPQNPKGIQLKAFIQSGKGKGVRNGIRITPHKEYSRSTGKTYWIGSDGSKTLMSESNKSTPVTRNPYFQSKYANRSKDINVNSIKQMQRMLGVKADGIWGDKTEAAYNSWLSSQQDPIIKKDDNITYTNTNATANNANYSKQTSGTLKSNYELNLPAGVSVAYQYLQNNPNLFAKKGGQLLSRNPIERFKQRNFRKVVQ